jgi:N4-(beta-N-acetylglucosaminyl)-L-asparaginase
MPKKLSRREFVKTGGIAAAGARTVFGSAPNVIIPQTVSPIVIASANGHRYKNGGDLTCVETAFKRIVEGLDVLESLVAGVEIVERDPTERGVGYGGLPNADGVVQLDSCCMHGARKRAGGVAALEGVRTPAAVAHAVMETTDHHLLVGEGAQHFARQMGFPIEDDLNTDESRRLWLEWKRRIDPEHYLDPKTRSFHGYEVGLQMVADLVRCVGRASFGHPPVPMPARGLDNRRDVARENVALPGKAIGDPPYLG